MSDPVVFADASPRLGLPLLYAGQAQKEFFVNEALATLDSLMHGAVEGVASAPPASAVEGTAWLVGPAPAGEWAGHADMIAARQAGAWLYAAPRDGMRLLDRATGQHILYAGGWRRPAPPAAPSGGATIDAEARVAIMQLIASLRAAGIFPAA